MRGVTPTRTFALCLMLGLAAPAAPAFSQEVAIGRTVESLLEFARDRNPEYAAMQAEAEAAAERVTPAGALPDPRFRIELRDITKSGDQNPTLSPSRVGSTRYLLSQDIPWFGKRDLNQVEIWFGIFQRKTLRNASFSSVDQLVEAIQKFTAAYNQNAAPFVWRKREVKGAQLRNTIVNLCN